MAQKLGVEGDVLVQGGVLRDREMVASEEGE
jgi:hypothetical protein